MAFPLLELQTKNQAEMQAEYERIESECEIAEMRRALIEVMAFL